MSRRTRKALLDVVCYTVTIAVTTWACADRVGVHVLAAVLDFPVAAVTAVVEATRWRWLSWLVGIDLWFGGGVGEYMPQDEILLWHLRASLVVYPALFGLALLLKRVVTRRR